MTTKLSNKVANAIANTKASRKPFDRTAYNPENLTPEQIEKMQSQDPTGPQMTKLKNLKIDTNPKPQSEGGPWNKMNASDAIERKLLDLKEKKELREAGEPTAKMLESARNFGVAEADLVGLTFGEVQQIIRHFIAEIEAREASRQAK